MPVKKTNKFNYYRTSYTEKQSPFKPSPPKKKRRQFKGVANLFFLILILAATVYTLILSSNPEVSINSNAYHTSEQYRQSVSKLMSSIKNRNKLSFDETELINTLMKEYPEINSAQIVLPLVGSNPKIQLEIAAPKFFANSQGVDYVVDSKGRAVAKKSDMPSQKGLPLVIDQTGYAVNVGQALLTESEVIFISNLIKQSKEAKIPIGTLVLPPKPMELYFRTKDRRYFTKFYLAGDSSVQIGQFLAARRHFDKINNQPKQYLDVRVNGKVYYK